MKNRAFTRVFDVETKKEELAKLLKTNFSYSKIARHFGVDHSSIIYQAEKMGLRRAKTYRPRYEKPKVKKNHCPRCDSLLKEGEEYCEWCLNEMK